MSSRLMNMKFMQRASAAGAANSPPVASPSEQTSSRKRQKLSNDSTAEPKASRPSSSGAAHASTTEVPNLEVILDRQAEAAGDTHWFVGESDIVQASPAGGMTVVPIGYEIIDTPKRDMGATEDAQETDGHALSLGKRTANGGRRSFGRFNKAIERLQYPDRPASPPHSSDKDDDVDEDKLSSLDEEDIDDAAERVRSHRHAPSGREDEEAKSDRKARERSEKEEQERLSRRKRPRDVDLDRITSISRGGSTASPLKCFTCGGPHKKDVCRSRAMKKRNKQR